MTKSENTSNWYEIRRNELLGLLEKTKDVQIPEESRLKLDEIRKKCLENQFEIVLIAEFQGGKSTTFNALCDGRDISPRGLGGGGLKTSAAKISAQNISDGETQNGLDEWAEITYKDKKEISESMFDLLGEDLFNDPEFLDSLKKDPDMSIEEIKSYCKVSPKFFAAYLDLDNPVHTDAVRKILHSYWDAWKYDKESLGKKKDLLQIATLAMRFYGTPEYQDLRKKTVLGIYDFQKMIAFPKDWEHRWTKGKNSDFTLAEASFVFIANALLRIKSKNLERLGCRITDCPGLFVNAYDTRVANQAIVASDAVWCLLNGEKQIGDEDLRNLKRIGDMGFEKRIIKSMNIRSDQNQKIKEILPVDVACLENNNYDSTLFPYNARLAFLANQGERILRGEKLSDYETSCMRKDYEKEGVEPADMWVKMTKKVAYSAELESLQEIDKLDEKAVEIAKKESKVEDILSLLEETIINNKAESILIDNGSKKAVEALGKYEAELQLKENTAIQKQEEFNKEQEEKQKKLNSFTADSDSLIKNSRIFSFVDKTSKNLAEELIDTAMINNHDFIKSCAKIIAIEVVNENKVFDLLPSSFNDEVKSKSLPKIAKEMQSAISMALEKWKDPQNGTEWKFLRSNWVELCQGIKNNWEKNLSNDDYFAKIELELPKTENFKIYLLECQKIVFDEENIIEKLDFWSFWTGVFHLLFGWIKSIISAFTGNNQESINKTAKEIEPKLEDCFYKIKAKISAKFIPFFQGIHKKLESEIRTTVENIKTRYMQDRDDAREMFNKSQDEREKIAKQNHNIRVNKIEPLRKEIERFENMVKKELEANKAQ